MSIPYYVGPVFGSNRCLFVFPSSESQDFPRGPPVCPRGAFSRLRCRWCLTRRRSLAQPMGAVEVIPSGK